MNGQDSNAEIFDVFLCHNSEDKPTVREIARRLSEKNIKPWLDEDEIRPGTSWQTALGQQIESIKSAAVFVGESGLGPWQNQEIQALLSQFVKRQCPVIPTVLPSAKATPDLPWTLVNLHWVDFRMTHADPLKQLIWGITGQKPREQSHVSSSNNPPEPRESDVKDLLPRKDKLVIELRLPGNLNEFSDKERDRILAGLYSLLEVGEVRVTRAMAGSIRLHVELKPEDADKIYAATKNGQLAALGISEVRLYPAIAVPPEGEQRSQLLILLDRVKETWVDGVLKYSLYNEALIALGKRPIDEAVEPPWKHVIELSSQRSQLLLQDRNITTIFNATGLLLILGEPGSGKTTTLLELAANLITRSKSDAKERVPFVLNLSSWKKKQPLAEWIAVELSEKYRLPVKIGRSWLQNDYLVPLLDGLDEVPTVLQPDCVAAINDFIDGSKPSGLVVCCRLMEYQWLPKRLKLNGAICLESLSSEEVSKYLVSGGLKLVALREAIETDPVLQELAQTPLMLSIMSLAYQGADGNELATHKGASPRLQPLFGSISHRAVAEERRKQIFRLYVEHMFQRKGTTSLMFPEEKIVGWLSWLAQKMKERSQSVFLVEGLCPDWLGPIGPKRAAYETVRTLIFALTFALIFVASAVLHLLDVFVALIFVLILVLTPLLIGPSGALLQNFWNFWMTHTVAGGQASPNQGIKLLLKSSLVVFLVASLTIGLIFGSISGLTTGFFSGLVVGLVVGLIGGGYSVINHYALRLTLCWNGYAPLNFVKFLDTCAQLILLKKVGGGYIFIHRMLLEYFADISNQDISVKRDSSISKTQK